ncbi:hypothetical protein ACFT08_31740 [Streptomyces rochei]|uniref:hypothetical protein n=1 Tax=Streptomyces rochei TaxID=1928 RepID=UPI003625C793
MEARLNRLHTEYGLSGDESAYFERELVPTRHWDGPDLVDCHAEVLRGDELQATVREAAPVRSRLGCLLLLISE